MTNTDKVQFAQAFNRLAVATRLAAKDADASMQQVYFDGLSDLPIEAVAAAASTLERGAEWFPKVREWRAAAHKVRRDERSRELPAHRQRLLPGGVEVSEPVKELMSAMGDFATMRKAGVTREDASRGLEGLIRAILPLSRAEPWHYECELCDDSGFERRTCYPERGPCGLRKCRGVREHAYTVRCVCWSTNRTLNRLRDQAFNR